MLAAEFIFVSMKKARSMGGLAKMTILAGCSREIALEMRIDLRMRYHTCESLVVRQSHVRIALAFWRKTFGRQNSLPLRSAPAGGSYSEQQALCHKWQNGKKPLDMLKFPARRDPLCAMGRTPKQPI